MPNLRLLIVDDAVTGRHVVARTMSEDGTLQVIGEAASAAAAQAKIAHLRPDVVVVAIEQDGDALALLSDIRRDHPTLPVIVYHGGGPAVTVEALMSGAADSLQRPAQRDHLPHHLHEELIPRIKAACAKRSEHLPQLHVSAPGERRRVGSRRVEVVVIGASTGGPMALAMVLGQLPGDFPVPVVVVQHMLPEFIPSLAVSLSAKCALPVHEGTADQMLQAGHVWLAPSGSHLVLVRDAAGIRMALEDGPPENSCRPAVDVLFRSAAKAFGGGTLAVMLTGIGQDGLRGCADVRQAEGHILVQDEATSVAWGMPSMVVKADLADQVLALDRIGVEVVRRTLQGREDRQATMPPSRRDR